MSARYDAMVEAWEWQNDKPAPLVVRRRFQLIVYGAHSRQDSRPARDAELRRLIKAQAKDRATRP